MTSPASGPVAASFSKLFCGTSSSWVFSTPVKFKLAVNLNGLACKRERETVILRQFTRRCYTEHWKAKSIRIIESTPVQQKKITALYRKTNFVFTLIDKANNYITCHRSCCSNFFTVARWNVTFFVFFETCKLKSVDYNKKTVTLKKMKIPTSKGLHSFFVVFVGWAFFVAFFL